MSQKRPGIFYVTDEDTNCDRRLDEHQDFVESLEKLKFTQLKTIEGNKFSTPFQDIWTNAEQTHQVYFVHDPVVDINYLRVRRISDKSVPKPKSIRKLGGWFPSKEYTEISVEAIEALENGDEEEQTEEN